MKPWFPQPGPQLAAIEADFCDEVFYGGERGGGKSDFQLGYQEDGALRYGKDWRGIMFRKTLIELEELQERAEAIFGTTGGVFKVKPSQGFSFSNCWYWPSGASVKMRYIENEKDYGHYHGHSYTGISFDEVTEYESPAPLLKMLSTLRSPADVPCTVRLTGNPGGVGHGWVKSRYIDVCPPRKPYTDAETGFTRMFIPSRLSDNKMLSDPAGYRNRILAATYGNEALRKAWLNGDWNIVAGAFFNCWSNALILRPVELPDWWTRFRSGDWGSARPFSFGWWVIAGETWNHPDGPIIPRGSLVRYREYYGCADPVKQPNVGLKLPAEEVAERILHLERGETVKYGVLDPAAFSSDGGPSIAERLYSGSGNKLIFRRADNARVASKGAMGGWDQMRARMLGEDGKPLIYCFSNCTDSIRTIPMLQHDDTRIEDVNSDMEDHCFVAGTLVETMDGPQPIETLVAGWVVTIGDKFARFRSGRLVKKQAEVTRLTFDSGLQITCTPDHRFLLDHDEWCYASELLNRSVLCSQPTAKRALCVGVEKLLDKHDVYCITVPETGCFALAGGLIVSNCADEWRYACMSRPYVRPKPEAPKPPKFLSETSLDELWATTEKASDRRRI